MKLNNPLYQIMFWFFVVLIAILFIFSCTKPLAEGHTCKWSKCPYKAVMTSQWHNKVQEYVGNDESVGFSLDMLHLQHPTWEYEQLEEAILND